MQAAKKHKNVKLGCNALKHEGKETDPVKVAFIYYINIILNNAHRLK
jgi:hypothetical protein